MDTADADTPEITETSPARGEPDTGRFMLFAGLHRYPAGCVTARAASTRSSTLPPTSPATMIDWAHAVGATTLEAVWERHG